jgi:hypothetical protein
LLKPQQAPEPPEALGQMARPSPMVSVQPVWSGLLICDKDDAGLRLSLGELAAWPANQPFSPVLLPPSVSSVG